MAGQRVEADAKSCGPGGVAADPATRSRHSTGAGSRPGVGVVSTFKYEDLACRAVRLATGMAGVASARVIIGPRRGGLVESRSHAVRREAACWTGGVELTPSPCATHALPQSQSKSPLNPAPTRGFFVIVSSSRARYIAEEKVAGGGCGGELIALVSSSQCIINVENA